MEKSYKEQVLKELAFLKDEPDIESDLFGFKIFASQLQNFLLDPKAPTPYTIGLHGEWGSGKTSLVYRIYKQISQKANNTDGSIENYKTIWFDAWEYEKLDPVLALMNRIALAYTGKNKQKFKQILKGLLLTTADLALHAYTPFGLEKIQKNFESTIKEIPTIAQKLESMVGNRRLIVFIDDLDRCLIDNVLGILEAIKLFLSARGVIFVIAVDMTKLERAWALRYQGSGTALQEGRDHVDKIFQLKLSLPPKTELDIESYVRNMSGSIEDKIRRLIIYGCPPNPRKLKKVINLIIFLLSSTDDNKFQKYFAPIVIWSIFTTVFPELSLEVKANPRSLVEMAMIAYHLRDLDGLELTMNGFKQMMVNKTQTVNISRVGSLSIKSENVSLQAVRGLEYIHATRNHQAFYFLQSIAECYGIIANNEASQNITPTLQRNYDDVGYLISRVILEAGLIA